MKHMLIGLIGLTGLIGARVVVGGANPQIADAEAEQTARRAAVARRFLDSRSAL
jgi:hypothetical protein